MSRHLVVLLAASLLRCALLIPEYGSCDETPYLTRSIDSGPACADYDDSCAFQIGRREAIVLTGQSCDSVYALEVNSLEADASLVEWQLDKANPSEVTVYLTPLSAGSFSLTFQYTWQGGSREFNIEAEIVAQN